ncbi:MAG: cupredoxin domain-containing protein [Patescibacteria group bacterium]|jgi:plastocyanin
MKKTFLFIVIGLALILVGCSPKTSQNQPATNQPVANINENINTSQNNITIQNFAFAPTNLVVTKGSTVTWTNQDSTIHAITASGTFDSGNLNQGQSFSHTFNEAGTFNYHCSIHPSMTGTITVQ